MKIVNETAWETKALRKLFAACLAEVRKTEKHPCTGNLKVKVVWHKSDWVGGRAGINSTWMTMKIPRLVTSRTFPQDVARIFIHELGHCLGINRHRNYHTIEHLYSDWIKENISDTNYHLVMIDKPKRRKPDAEARLQNALKNLRTAQTRIKRAKTLLNKWVRRVKYYEKMAMSQPKSVTLQELNVEKLQ